MKLPPITGTCNQTEFFIYAACDVGYFDCFGREFIASIKQNTTAGIHIHLFNPRQDQIDYCLDQQATVTWESVPLALFESAATTQLEPTQLARTVNAMSKSEDQHLIERLQKTYYACARFVRLQEIFTDTVPVLELDIDAVVRRPIDQLPADCDLHIHHITGKNARYLAGGLWLNACTRANKFLIDYARQLRFYLESDYIYWGLDQDLLDSIVPKFDHKQLPASYIDWNMNPDSTVWTAKGTRKNLKIFVNEQQKYKF